MSDPTKKSIIINKSFLSGSDNSGSLNVQNKKSKRNTRNLSEEIIKPNKLKKMLLDKINAKRKADHTSYTGSISENKVDSLDISKETKLFSSEFKKSLDFLDSYIGQKRNDKNKNNNKTKTLKNQHPTPSTSLNNDILKSLHINNVTSTHSLYPPNNINQHFQTQTYAAQSVHTAQAAQPVHRAQAAQAAPAAQAIPITAHAPHPHHPPHSHHSHHPPHSHHQQHTHPPLFQKIELQLPNKTQQIRPPQGISSSVLPNTVPKINLAIGKPMNSSFVYTELPPELQNFTPPVYSISSPSISSMEVPVMSDSLPPLSMDTRMDVVSNKPIDVIDSRDNDKIEYNNSGVLGIETSMENGMDSMELSGTSLFPTSTTFSPIKLSDDSPYGCLKNGKKPTFRTYNKTIKNNLRFYDNESNLDSTHSDRQTKLKELQNKHNKNASTLSQDNKKSKQDKDESENENNESSIDETKNKHNLRKTKIRRRFQKTITKKFKLGKQQGNIVGVLIKNNDTRKNIQKEHGLLKSKQLGEVKKYLVEKNLIKIGSTAPPGVIRNIYEASMLSGEVENIGKGIGLHNFLEDKSAW
jgi:hypothetical protein